MPSQNTGIATPTLRDDRERCVPAVDFTAARSEWQRDDDGERKPSRVSGRDLIRLPISPRTLARLTTRCRGQSARVSEEADELHQQRLVEPSWARAAAICASVAPPPSSALRIARQEAKQDEQHYGAMKARR